MIPLGIEPATFRLVAQYPNRLRHRVPPHCKVVNEFIFFPVLARNAYRESRGLPPVMLNLGTKWRWGLPSRPCCFNPRKEHQYPFDIRLRISLRVLGMSTPSVLGNSWNSNPRVTKRLICFIINPTRCTNFSNLFWKWNSTCFGQFLCPSSGVIHCTLSNGSWSWSWPKAVYKPVWYIPLLTVQWITPDDGQRNCPKHVEFHLQNKFEKLVHLVGFIIRNLSRRTVTRMWNWLICLPSGL
jgi:hypothetical protein